jgi:hypothetical protein
MIGPTNKKPRRAANTCGAGANAGLRALYGNRKATASRKGWQSSRLPENWRDRLPDPASYYRAHVYKLSRPNATGWAQGACPFHEDGNASLSVHATDARGGWRCFAGCGHGDLLAFHQRRTGLGFRDAVADLLMWRA